ncbi:phosphodiester glycosidase family protein [Mycolicibacterium arenosum]|uniref:Phosphodiester glycosidase family protein n=1 Tax=Mycolicibacterium arenosum TaxID=2952157 RepID=A0ABT1ME38_9MYCO|nr:phosphodiester glycosidase family protein [Mycolicibacterium sp. CAU 1645]MCP9276464.1 phosphodiester glycosidase family protein [Mycolicibacterium sp. CAU 1645]
MTHLLVLVVAIVTALGSGYAVLSSGPGYAPWQDRASTLLRQLGFGGPLDAFENWLYSRHAPPDTSPDANGLLGAFDHSAPNGPRASYRHLPALPGTADGLGWHPVVRTPGTSPAIYAALLQPDRFHRSVVAGAALIRTDTARAHLVQGTKEPAGSHGSGKIPAAELPNVLAAFNSGFKMSADPGGFFLNGVTVHDLLDGKASAVIDDRGRMTVGQWGRDVAMSPHVVAVRQNLALIVDNGQPVPGLDHNVDLRWGSARNQLQYTWRSGLGATAHGDLIYVAGDQLNLAALGAALTQAGAVTAMELDIHSGLQFFSAWVDASGGPSPQRLLSTMTGPADRYVRPDTRDFFYFTTAGGVGH